VVANCEQNFVLNKVMLNIVAFEMTRPSPVAAAGAAPWGRGRLVGLALAGTLGGGGSPAECILELRYKGLPARASSCSAVPVLASANPLTLTLTLIRC